MVEEVGVRRGVRAFNLEDVVEVGGGEGVGGQGECTP